MTQYTRCPICGTGWLNWLYPPDSAPWCYCGLCRAEFTIPQLDHILATAPERGKQDRKRLEKERGARPDLP